MYAQVLNLFLIAMLLQTYIRYTSYCYLRTNGAKFWEVEFTVIHTSQQTLNKWQNCR